MKYLRFILLSKNGLLLIRIYVTFSPNEKPLFGQEWIWKTEKEGWRPPPFFMVLSCFLMERPLFVLAFKRKFNKRKKVWAKVDLLLEELINICPKKGQDMADRLDFPLFFNEVCDRQFLGSFSWFLIFRIQKCSKLRALKLHWN